MSSPSAPWQDVQIKGYAVVPSFLDAPEISRLIEQFEKAQQRPRKNLNFETPFLPYGRLKPFTNKLLAAARAASSSTQIYDRLGMGIFYATKLYGKRKASSSDWNWHTDTTIHYVAPNYLNFWVPLVKPDRQRSGLQVVGFDALEARHPELAHSLRGRGSTRVIQRDGSTIFRDTARRMNIAIADPNLLEGLAQTPTLGPGDCLVMRNDVFHRTQDNETDRVAISFRVFGSTTVVSRQALMDMSSAKFNNMARVRSAFARRFAAFQIAGCDQISNVLYDTLHGELTKREYNLQLARGGTELDDIDFEQLVYELAQEYRGGAFRGG